MLACAAVFAATSDAIAEDAGQLLLCAGGSELFVVDARSAESGTIRKLWSWSGETAVGLADAERPRFRNLDECRAVADGRKILITASNSGCALLSYPAGEILWQASVTNAHSIELLPRERVVVASSLSGDALVVFDLATSQKPLYRTPLRSAHGVVWDPATERLWALGFDELRTYRLENWETAQPSLSLDETFPLPDDDGHDLRAVPHGNDLALTTAKSVLLFDRSTKKFRKHPQVPQLEHVKSLDVHPATGRVVVGRWSKELSLFEPEGVITFTENRPYKIRWFAGAAP
ncbi:MAG: hypothetical protein C0483_25475 [Pirellula sp.]|nr:hypothetical protein [Pirellula sp.]